MIAYMAVSSMADPTPWARRMAKHQAAKGSPGGRSDATEKQIVDTDTIEMPQM